jgi:hypothetical protein
MLAIINAFCILFASSFLSKLRLRDSKNSLYKHALDGRFLMNGECAWHPCASLLFFFKSKLISKMRKVRLQRIPLFAYASSLQIHRLLCLQHIMNFISFLIKWRERDALVTTKEFKIKKNFYHIN